jgi:hypothetical protein
VAGLVPSTGGPTGAVPGKGGVQAVAVGRAVVTGGGVVAVVTGGVVAGGEADELAAVADPGVPDASPPHPVVAKRANATMAMAATEKLKCLMRLSYLAYAGLRAFLHKHGKLTAEKARS